MNERHVYVKLIDPARAADLADRARGVLGGLPGVRSVAVRVPADAGARVWDLAVILALDDLAAAEATEPFFASEVDPVAQIRKAWNFRPA